METDMVEQLIAQSFDLLPVSVLIQSPDGRVLHSNARARSGLHQSGEELHGRDAHDDLWVMVDEDGRSIPPEEYPGVIAGRTGTPVMGRLVGVAVGSTELRWVNLDAVPLFDDSGEVLAVAVTMRNVTDETRAAHALRRSEVRLERARRAGGVGLWEWDPHMRTLTFDEQFVTVLGGHVPATIDEWLDLVHPDDRARMRTDLFDPASLGDHVAHHRFISTDGERRWFRMHSEVVSSDEHGARRGALTGTVVDTTELCRTTERVTELLDYMTDAYFTIDRDGNFTFLNRAATALLDPVASGLIGTNLFETFPKEAHDLRFRYERVLAGEAVEFEKYYQLLGGWFEVRAHPVPDGVAVYFRDIDDDWNARHERERLLASANAANEQLKVTVTTDQLTGLMNRSCLIDWLDERIRDGSNPSVLFIDLDRFKMVNDTHGHVEGDLLLREVARRLEGLVRDGDVVARLGGDEFVIGLASESNAAAYALAARVLDEVRLPIDLRSRRIVVNASVGIAFATAGATAETMLRDSDAAMYQAKDGGRNRAEVFDDRIRQTIVKRLDVEVDLHGAAERGEIRAAYQAMFDARTGRPVGVEALARWRHPRRGLVGAGGFVPVAEDSGLIVEIGDAMLRVAMDDLEQLAVALGGDQTRVWVNVASRQLDEPGFASSLLDQLTERGLVGAIGLEVTETGLIRDHTGTASSLSHLADSGVPIAIDDFGTGYSSLARLIDFPVDMLKIDQSFVRGLPNHSTAGVIAAVVEVAHAIGAMTCAEGIETPEQLDTVLALGVDLLSGYHLGRPVPLEAVATSIAEPRRLVAEAIGRTRSTHPTGLDAAWTAAP